MDQIYIGINEVYDNLIKTGFRDEIAYKMAKDICNGWPIEPINHYTTHTIKQYEYKINVKPGQKRKYICIEETSIY